MGPTGGAVETHTRVPSGSDPAVNWVAAYVEVARELDDLVREECGWMPVSNKCSGDQLRRILRKHLEWECQEHPLAPQVIRMQRGLGWLPEETTKPILRLYTEIETCKRVIKDHCVENEGVCPPLPRLLAVLAKLPPPPGSTVAPDPAEADDASLVPVLSDETLDPAVYDADGACLIPIPPQED